MSGTHLMYIFKNQPHVRVVVSMSVWPYLCNIPGLKVMQIGNNRIVHFHKQKVSIRVI